MNLKGFLKYSVVIGALMLPFVSCQKFLDVNTDPNAVKEAPIEQLFTSATTSLGFFAGSDLHRYSSLLTQQLSGQGAGAITQTQEYERYNIAGSDLNNAWNLAYSTVLSDLELVVQKASKENCAHYGGCAKIMKAYTFSLLADAWGMLPFTDALKFKANLNPKFDDASTVYPALIAMIDEGIADTKNAASLKSPGTNSTIYSGSWLANQPRWEAFGNALKMRLWLHTIKVDKAKALTAMTTLSAGTLMTSTADNFQMPFVNVSRQQNPIHQFELDRINQLFSNATLVDMMNARVDPRRARYFISYPIYSGSYKGAKGGDAPSINYSRMHIYLRGDTTAAATITGGTSGNYAYNGTAPIRMLTYAELQFIRAEAAVLNGGMLGTVSADSFFRSGIRASMSQAGILAITAEIYINSMTGGVLNGALTGTDAEKVKKIIEEKFIANFGVVMEPWSDWRRTGVPALPIPPNALVPTTPRSFFYPQSEIDLNPNAPKQKTDMTVKVFWDK